MRPLTFHPFTPFFYIDTIKHRTVVSLFLLWFFFFAFLCLFVVVVFCFGFFFRCCFFLFVVFFLFVCFLFFFCFCFFFFFFFLAGRGLFCFVLLKRIQMKQISMDVHLHFSGSFFGQLDKYKIMQVLISRLEKRVTDKHKGVKINICIDRYVYIYIYIYIYIQS